MSLIPNLLRLLLLLMMPLWLSLAAEELGLRLSLTPVLSDWLRKDKSGDLPIELPTSPPAGWREATYLEANPDVAQAVREGALTSGYVHYVRYGRAEGRPGGLGSPPPRKKPPAKTPAPVAETTVAVVPPTAPPTAPPTVPAAQPAPAPPPPIPAPVVAPAAKPKTAPAPAPVLVSRVRTANSDQGVRIVLDVDGPPRFTPPARGATDRVVIALPGTLWKTAPAGPLLPTLLTYRAETVGTAPSRLIISGPNPLEAKAVFAMPPDKERGHRLVIDLTPTKRPAAKKQP